MGRKKMRLDSSEECALFVQTEKMLADSIRRVRDRETFPYYFCDEQNGICSLIKEYEKLKTELKP